LRAADSVDVFVLGPAHRLRGFHMLPGQIRIGR
jgi:hypothetical protein